MDYAYYNGAITEYDKMAIPLYDRAIFFGEGVYDVCIGNNQNIYQPEEHVNRLIENAKRMNLYTNGLQNELMEAIRKTVEMKGSDPFTLYMQISGKSRRRMHKYETGSLPNLLVTVTDLKLEINDKPIDLISAPDRRYEYCNIKTINILPNIMCANIAFSKKCDECVFLKDGVVTECSHSNILIIKDGVFITHPNNEKILPGITKGNLLNVCRNFGIKVAENKFSYEELTKADEVIITSTTKFARRCKSIDGKKCGMKSENLAMKIINELRHCFFSTTHT